MQCGGNRLGDTLLLNAVCPSNTFAMHYASSFRIALLLLVALLVQIAHGQHPAPILTPASTGPFGVGRKLLEWTDHARREPADTTQVRRVPIWVWYPSAKADSNWSEAPLSADWRAAQTAYLTQKIGPEGASFLAQLQVRARTDAPIVRGKERFPVLIFGPGHTWLPTDYSTLIEELVSHGYVVVGYVPTSLASATRLSSGRILKATLDIHQQDVCFQDALLVRRKLALLDAPDSWLLGRIDLNRVGMFGHSQGGAAALVAAARDSTVCPVVNLDSDLMGTALTVSTTQPCLMISHDERPDITSEPNQGVRRGRERSEYRRHADWVRATDKAPVSLRVRIEDTQHMNFADLALIAPSVMTAAQRRNRLSSLDGARGLAVAADLTRLFFDRILKGGPSYTLESIEKQYPEVQALLWRGYAFY